MHGFFLWPQCFIRPHFQAQSQHAQINHTAVLTLLLLRGKFAQVLTALAAKR